MRLTISITNWFECELYLKQNYFSYRRDYYYYTRGGIVDIEFVNCDAYDMFSTRWADRLLSG